MEGMLIILGVGGLIILSLVIHDRLAERKKSTPSQLPK